jgi:hypothetical protein
MLLKILVVVLVLILATLVLAATKPSTFSVHRSIDVNASSAKVFALINDFHQWPLWAPQDREDLTMQRTYGSQSAGVGAMSQWTSRGSAGAGEMMITGSTPNSVVTVTVNWTKPFRVRNAHVFKITPEGEHLRVSWDAEGSNLYIMKVMEVFVGVDGLMGKHFEAGLKNLKAAAEEVR